MRLIQIIIFSFLFYITNTYSQELPSYSKIIEVDQDKSKLYLNIRNWAFETFPKNSIDLRIDDKESNHIMFKSTMPFERDEIGLDMINGKIDFDIDLKSKDGKVKIELDNFLHIGTKLSIINTTYKFGYFSMDSLCSQNETPFTEKAETEFCKELNYEIDKVSTSLMNSLEKYLKNSEDDDW